ncbi:MAG: cytochrome b [Steroidobacteraceae bacterium]
MKTSSRYHSVSIALHWFMLVLIATVYCLMEFRDIYPRGSEPREMMKTWHYMLGLSVFALVLIRLALRTAFTAPPISPTPPAWQTGLSHALHAALYLLMIGMPLGGWLLLSAEGSSIPFFGVALPPLVAPNEVLAETIEEIHEAGSKVGYALIAIHTLAGLAHHYVFRDNALQRMSPFPSEKNL